MKKLWCSVRRSDAEGSVRAVEVSAPSALLMEKETGAVLYAKDEHAKLEPASVTKIMTILLTMEAIDSGVLHYDDVVTASAHACSMGGSQIWLKENEQMTVSDMLKAVCVAAERLRRGAGGDGGRQRGGLCRSE
ncbi:D-alanyl-D-alanine carboxypeptidase family protein [Dysosmobacter welbionis]|uniref:D-alanyl-D-alanine carboxypeptidase family protein n=1 Tax=Dysosmobacter welbionis TaxID=2093857 RepID=UPI00300EFD22